MLETINLKTIDASDVECYRGMKGYVIIYYKDGRVFKVNETFKAVDEFLDI